MMATVTVPISRLINTCLKASMTWRDEFKSARWKPTKREPVRAPSRALICKAADATKNRLTNASTVQRLLSQYLFFDWACRAS